MTRKSKPPKADKQKQYTDHYKRFAVGLLQYPGETIASVSEQLEISPTLLSSWADEFGVSESDEKKATYDELMREHRRLTKEVEFLRAVHKYFKSRK